MKKLPKLMVGRRGEAPLILPYILRNFQTGRSRELIVVECLDALRNTQLAARRNRWFPGGDSDAEVSCAFRFDHLARDV